MGLATLIIAALLSVLPPIDLRGLPTLVELLVRLVPPEAEPQAGPPREAAAGAAMPEPFAQPSSASPTDRTPAAGAVRSPEAARPAPVDWAGERERAVRGFPDRQDAIASPSPGMAEIRRRLAGQYPPPARELPKPIWENAEIDQVGRTVLRAGDCIRVLDDPNVTREYQFREFDQYLVTCSYYKREPTELPWVAGLRERYAYLRYPDGIVPDEEDRPQ